MSFRGFSHSTHMYLGCWECLTFNVQHVHCSAVILCCALSGDCVEYLCILQYVCAVKAVLTLAGRGAIISHFPETPSPVSVLTAIIFLFLDAFLICTLLPFRKIHVWALPDYLLEPESSRLKQFQNAILHPHVNFNISIVIFFLLFRKHRKIPTLIWKHYVHVDLDLEFIFQ